MQETGAEEWIKVHEKNLRLTEHTATGLSAGKKYCFRVAAVNINGMGDFSDPCAETEPVERIGMFKQLLNVCISSVFCNKFSFFIIYFIIIYSRNS